MSIQVTIAVNHQQVQAISIGRLESLSGTDETHKYGVYRGTGRDGNFATFTHKYSDGIEKCVSLALEALDEECPDREFRDTPYQTHVESRVPKD